MSVKNIGKKFSIVFNDGLLCVTWNHKASLSLLSNGVKNVKWHEKLNNITVDWMENDQKLNMKLLGKNE